MARTDTLPHFLTDVADAIREKGGTSEPIQASDFDTEIENLPSGGGADLSDYFESTIGTGSSNFGGWCYTVKSLPATTTVDGTNLSNAFTKFQGTTLPLIDTSNVDTIAGMCSNCPNLTSIPLLNTLNVTNMNNTFNNCPSLTTVPLLNTSNATNMNLTFYNCPNLTDTSLDNILQMCINSNIIISSKKNLKNMGFTSTDYPTSRIEALPHYQDFIDAGWIIGY